MSVFSSKKTQQGVYAAEEAKEKTQTESKQKACMGKIGRASCRERV